MARRDFDRDETISPPTRATVPYTDASGTKTSASISYIPKSISTSYYSTIRYADPVSREARTSDVLTRRVSEVTSVLAAINPSLCKSYLENGVAPNLSAPSFARTITEVTSGMGKDGPVAVKEVVDEYLSQFAFAGGVGIQEYVINGEPVNLTNALVHVSSTVTDYVVNENAGITKTRVTRYLAWGTTAEGRDLASAVASRAETAGELLELINAMTAFVCDGTKVQTVTGRDYGLQLRPSEQDEERQRLDTAWNIGDTDDDENPVVDWEDVDFDFGLPEDDGFVVPDFSEPDRIEIGDWDLPTTDEPLDPEIGDTWIDANTDEPFVWDGDDWVPFTPDPPDDPDIDDKWIDSDTSIPYRWDGVEWAPYEISNTDYEAFPLPGDIRLDPETNTPSVWNGEDWVPYTTTPPVDPALDDTYVNPDTGVERIWNGGEWEPTGVVYGSTPASNINLNANDDVQATVIELPFPNDDTLAFERTLDGAWRQWVVPGNVQEQARELAILENSLRYGNSYGANIVVEPWVMPTTPLAPFTVRAGGLEVQYLVDGPAWEFDGELFVASCDGILCGVTGKVEGQRILPWVPTKVSLSNLPTVSAVTTGLTAKPANTIPAPARFRAARPGGIWNLLPTNGVDTFEQYGTPAKVFPPFSVGENEVVTTRTLAIELEVEWSLRPIDEGTEDLVTITTLGDVDDGLMALVRLPASVLSLTAVAPVVDTDEASTVQLPVTTLTLAPMAPVVENPGVVQLPVTTLTLGAVAPVVTADPTVVQLPVTTLALSTPVPAVSEVSSAALGEGTLHGGIFLFPADPLYLFEPD